MGRPIANLMRHNKSLPEATRSLIEAAAADQWVRGQTQSVPLPARYIVGIRGYRQGTPGKPDVPDVGIWDDAMFYISPNMFLAENANTDPSRYGWNAAAGKPMAVLDAGCWPFRRGPHKGNTPAFRQMTRAEAAKVNAPFDGRFAVTRCYATKDTRNYAEAGYYAINIHPEGNVGTSSEGCQTLPADRAQTFLQQIWDDTLAAKMPFVWYILIEGLIV